MAWKAVSGDVAESSETAAEFHAPSTVDDVVITTAIQGECAACSDVFRFSCAEDRAGFYEGTANVRFVANSLRRSNVSKWPSAAGRPSRKPSLVKAYWPLLSE
jgi:hypothetical protein